MGTGAIPTETPAAEPLREVRKCRLVLDEVFDQGGGHKACKAPTPTADPTKPANASPSHIALVSQFTCQDATRQILKSSDRRCFTCVA